MLFEGLGAGELLVIILFAVVMFGPERIPEYSRKAARVVHYLRGVANSATTQLKEELGPEYADLTVADLNPKTFLRKTLLNDLQSDLDEIKSDLNVVRTELSTSSRDGVVAAQSALDSASASAVSASSLLAETNVDEPAHSPFDPEST